jgi:hypothetical protein
LLSHHQILSLKKVSRQFMESLNGENPQEKIRRCFKLPMDLLEITIHNEWSMVNGEELIIY